MTRGQSQPGVKSHRRGRRRRIIRRKLPVAPWIVISTVLTLVASGLVAGYMWLLGVGCSGDPIRATVAVAPSIQSTLSTLAHQWELEEPAVDGKCIGVDIVKKSSAEMASRLGGNWNAETDGAPPQIWIPESMAWLQMARLTDAGAAMIPAKTPFIATSPTVIAMPAPMAKALGWQKGGDPVDGVDPSWKSLVKLAKNEDWSSFGKDWGDITIGISNPKDSTPGLHALLSLVDDNQNGTVDSNELDNVGALRSATKQSTESVDDLLEGMEDADADGKPMEYVSAFPALERDVWRYNQGQTKTKLTAVYPSDGSIDADHPLAVLQNAPWTNETYQEIGKQFADFLTSDESQQSIKKDNYRDGSHRSGGESLTQAEGMVPQIAEPQREPVQPLTVYNTLTTWQALNQSTNMLIVVDSSESMNTMDTLDGKKKSRLDIVKDELKKTLDLFGEKTNVGLWQYGSDLDLANGTDYLELLSMGDLKGSRRADAEAAIDSMTATGGSALYDTSVAAYDRLLANYNDDQGAVNLVVLISDGGNEDPSGGMSAKDMQSSLESLQVDNGRKAASMMTIGYGPDADAKQLTDVATSARGQYNPAKYADQINTALLNALFYAD